MPVTWDKMDKAQLPTAKQVSAYVGNPLWDELCGYLETRYQTAGTFEYSGCCVPGWNVKYKMAGRALCTLYPMQGSFTALVVIGEREKVEFELTLPTLTPYTRELFQTTKDKNGLCWLMLAVKDKEILSDVKRCIAIRKLLPSG